MVKQYVMVCGLLSWTLQAGNGLACMKAEGEKVKQDAAQIGQQVLPEVETFGQEAASALKIGAEDAAKYALTQLISSQLEARKFQELEKALHVSITEDANGLFAFSVFGKQLGTWQGIAGSDALVSALVTNAATAIVAAKAASPSSAASSSVAASSSQS